MLVVRCCFNATHNFISFTFPCVLIDLLCFFPTKFHEVHRFHVFLAFTQYTSLFRLTISQFRFQQITVIICQFQF